MRRDGWSGATHSSSEEKRATMKTKTTAHVTAATPVATDTVASTLSSMANTLVFPVLTKNDRRRLQSRNESVPDELVELMCQLADQGGGQILGTPFDAAATRATLAQTSTTRSQVGIGRQALQRVEDDMIQKRATVADPTFAMYASLRRLVNTKAGNSLLPAYTQMKAIVKNRPRKRRAKKTDEVATAAATPATAPAVSQPSAPAAAPKAVVSPAN